MSDPASPQLDYGAPPPLRRRARFHRRAIGLAVVGALLWSLWWAPSLWHNVRAVYRERQCRAYVAPADQVVYDEDFAAGRVVTARGAAAWDAMYPFIRYADAPKAAKAVLFLHGRRSAEGVSRLVVVEYSRRVWSDGVELTTWWPDPAALGTPPAVVAGFARLPLPGSEGAGRLRFYAGQPDPADESHFTIAFDVDGRPGTLDGWLRADGLVDGLGVPDPGAVGHRPYVALRVRGQAPPPPPRRTPR